MYNEMGDHCSPLLRKLLVGLLIVAFVDVTTFVWWDILAVELKTETVFSLPCSTT